MVLSTGRAPAGEPVAGVAPIMRYRLLRPQPGARPQTDPRALTERRGGLWAGRAQRPGQGQRSASDPARSSRSASRFIP
jgi:hypothetical protein